MMVMTQRKYFSNEPKRTLSRRRTIVMIMMKKKPHLKNKTKRSYLSTYIERPRPGGGEEFVQHYEQDVLACKKNMFGPRRRRRKQRMIDLKKNLRKVLLRRKSQAQGKSKCHACEGCQTKAGGTLFCKTCMNLWQILDKKKFFYLFLFALLLGTI